MSAEKGEQLKNRLGQAGGIILTSLATLVNPVIDIPAKESLRVAGLLATGGLQTIGHALIDATTESWNSVVQSGGTVALATLATIAGFYIFGRFSGKSMIYKLSNKG